MKKQLQAHFSHSFRGDIWQQSLSGHWLLITLRDTEQMQVSFSMLDLRDGSLLFEEMTFDENWWIDACHFFGETIVFQVYEDSQDIEQKTYFALNIHEHEVLWSLDKVVTTGRHGHYLQLKSLEEDVLFFLDIRNGETFSEAPENYADQPIAETLRHPLLYTEESPFFETIRAFGVQKFGKELTKGCHYLEQNGLVLMAYQYETAAGLTQELVVLDPASKPLLQRVLHRGNRGLASEAFFIACEKLIFVEGKNTLNGFKTEN